MTKKLKIKTTILAFFAMVFALALTVYAAPFAIEQLRLTGAADAGGHSITNAGDVVTAAGKSLTTVAGLAEAAIQPSTVISNLTVAPATPLRTEMVVAGFGEAEVNGTYAKVSDANGKSAYELDAITQLRWESTLLWVIKRDGLALYTSADNVAEPDLVTNWSAGGIAVPPISTVTPDYGDPVTVEDLQPKPGGEFKVINTTNLVFITSGNTATNSIVADITASVLAE